MSTSRWPLAVLCLSLCLSVWSTSPEAHTGGSAGFVEEEIAPGWNSATGLTFDANGRMYVWDKAGRIWIVENGDRRVSPLLDISEEVGNWRDYGLLGVTLDPNFLSNGYVYLLYVVDRHHLLHFGTGSYDPDTNEYFDATIGRITRYTADAGDNFNSVVAGSRLVLVGETKETGTPIVHQSHGTGSLAFGTDGTLLAASGDGASYSATDNGGSVGGSYASQALSDGIITTKEDVGAFRSQLVDSLAGKVIRIDPATGDGLASNPFYDAAEPRAPRSRVWSMGHRNPYKMTLRPNSGGHVPSEANPGALFIGDVGWGTWEDINVNDAPGQNFGWPIYEGFNFHDGYSNNRADNLDAPNPLNGSGGCNQEYFEFHDLLAEDDATPTWPNPCDSAEQVPANLRHVHRRPAIDFRHGSGPSRTGIRDAQGFADTIDLDDPGSPVLGDRFGGNASTGGTFYTTGNYPSQFDGSYFHGDYGAGWIRVLHFDSNNDPTDVEPFFDSGRKPVAFSTNPVTGDVYYVDYPSRVVRLKYVGDGDLPPDARFALERDSGDAPLEVRFFGDLSVDPEAGYLSFQWDFGDGFTSTDMNPIHTYDPGTQSVTNYTASLTVTDEGAQSDQITALISVNNTAPDVTITSPTDGSSFSHVSETIVSLDASFSDAEDPTGSLSCEWQVFLHHNEHIHPEPIDYACSTSATLSPIGCDGNVYYYRVVLNVFDTEGLVGTDEVNVYPDCSMTLQASAGVDQIVVDQTRDGVETVSLDGSASSDPNYTITSYSWRIDENEIANGAQPQVELPVGSTVVTLVVYNDNGDAAVDTLRVTVDPGNGSLTSPEARFTASRRSGPVSLPVGFDASPSTDPDGALVSYDWDFGDGNVDTGLAPLHIFRAVGEYDVVLTVTDDDGLTDTRTMRIVVSETAPAATGVPYEYYEGTWDNLPDFDSLTPVSTGEQENFSIAPRQQNNNFGFRFDTCINISSAGDYTFYTTSDDGSKLYIDGTEIVDNDGTHSSREREGTTNLTAGLHPLRVTFFEKSGSEVLEVRYEGPGIGKQLIPGSVLIKDGCAGGPNQIPNAVDDLESAQRGAQSVFTVLDNDDDPDLDPLTIVDVDDPVHGTATTDGSTITYTHDGSQADSDGFRYTIDDGNGASDSALVEVSMCAVNDLTCDGFDDDCDGSLDEDAVVSVDGVTVQQVGAISELSWIDSGASFYSVYRGYRIDGDPWVYTHQCLDFDLTTTTYSEADSPRPGVILYYLLASSCAAGSEGDLGTDSAGTTRPKAHVCPDQDRDEDGDGFEDALDNCPLISNPGQFDSDGDQRGNDCDNCDDTPNQRQEDSDNDGIGDACDPT